MGLLGTVSAVGTALGPSLGGLLLAWAGWPSLFVTIAALGAVTFALGMRFFGRTTSSMPSRPTFDVPGFLTLGVALGAYSLSMTLASLAIECLAIAAVAIAAFIVVELRAKAPLVSISNLSDRALTSSLIALAFVTSIVMATLVVGPFYLTGTAGLNSTEAGLVMSIGPAVSAIVGIPAGRLVDRLGPRQAMLAGLVLSTGGCLLMVVLPGQFGVLGYCLALALVTGGYALFQAANNASVMKEAPNAQRGVFSGLLGLFRNLGLITGASAMGAVFTNASKGVPWLALPPGGLSGLQLTFIVCAIVAIVSIGLTLAKHVSALHETGGKR
jgi:MFS family permease